MSFLHSQDKASASLTSKAQFPNSIFWKYIYHWRKDSWLLFTEAKLFTENFKCCWQLVCFNLIFLSFEFELLELFPQQAAGDPRKHLFQEHSQRKQGGRSITWNHVSFHRDTAWYQKNLAGSCFQVASSVIHSKSPELQFKITGMSQTLDLVNKSCRWFNLTFPSSFFSCEMNGLLFFTATSSVLFLTSSKDSKNSNLKEKNWKGMF